MAYKQLRAPNFGVTGQSGYCLIYARTVFGVASKYPTAAVAWSKAVYKHTGTPPSEVAVPVWFKYGADGHVAIAYQGKVHSTTAQGVKIFDSVQACAAYIHGTPLGWSEDINGVRVAVPVGAPVPPPSGLPPVGSRFQLIPTQVRTTFKAGTDTVAGHINVTDGTFYYTVRNHDPVFHGRVIINSASGGGNGVALALYYKTGARVDGWKQI